jgi:hypothetical protein
MNHVTAQRSPIPPALTPLEVPCPLCRAAVGVRCHRKDGSKIMRGTHDERVQWRDELLVRATGNEGNARWFRYRLRHGLVPTKPGSHGDEAGYVRHVRSGEEPCAECIEGVRILWAKRKRDARAAAKAAKAANNNTPDTESLTTP